MAVRATMAFFAGVAVGWVGRSTLGSSREAMVQALVLTHGVREKLKRTVAENVEWVEDMVAEGRARYESKRDASAIEHDMPPHIVDVKKRRGHAA